jgi:NAD(P)-dependent dehydrogenase (short-subunit alcohol dehydrogenase family)
MTTNKRNVSATVAAGLIGLALGARAAIRWRRRISLPGKVVLITGGSRGLGLVLAREFARQGARVAICARDEQELNRARADLGKQHADVLAVQCDVTSRAQVDGMIDGLVRHFGSIDILVNNAGTICVGPMEEMNLEDYQDAMNQHFCAPLYSTMAVLPQMKRRHGGRIVNISSIGGKIAVPHLLPYSASKFALAGFSEGLRSELKKNNIFVTTVCPGLMRTGSPRNATFKGKHRAEYAWFAISDSLPLASIGARAAARRIIRACRYGQAETMVSLSARLAITLHGLLPGFSTELMAFIHGALPGPGGIGTAHALGSESKSSVAPSRLTALTERAGEANNEI